MTQIKAITVEQLRAFCEPAQFSFKTTDDLPDYEGIVGQERAIDAMSFGIGMKRTGYNMYLMGSTGLGKHTLLKRFLDKASAEQAVADDLCYLNNFDDPQKPKAIRLPAGQARSFRNDLQQLVKDLQTAIPGAFESEQYYVRIQEERDNLQEKINKAFDELDKEAKEHSVVIFRRNDILTFVPTKNNKSLSPDEYDALPEKERERFEEIISVLEERLRNLYYQRTLWQKETKDNVDAINREVGLFASSHLITEVKERYSHIDEVAKYMDDIQHDVIDKLYEFGTMEHSESGDELADVSGFEQYDINIMVDNHELKGAPVVYEDNPVYQNLLGRVEYISSMGTLVTNFRFIKAGSLHKANGGYLIIDAQKLLTQPLSWDALKRTLISRKITIQSLADVFGLVSTVSLEPEPVELDVKIILVGSRTLYYLLEELDPDFSELFKVEVDFSESIDSSKESFTQYAQVIATLVRKNGLMAFEQDAVKKVIEYGMRQIEDTTRISTHMHSMTDLLIESDYYAKQEGQKCVRRADVQMAEDKQIYRADRGREAIYDEVKKGTILINVSGEKIATVNGLFIIQMGRLEFSQPARITATVRIGDGDIVDIEREVDLGGAIHSKGVLILTSYLGANYAIKKPLSLAASLVFEQSYGQVDGDSATVGELCALLSAISGIPVSQSFAITGSADQHGNVQAIGGVNEKIEGFFDICKEKGFTGSQGVIIPAANVPHLILRDDVIEAVAKDEFRIYPIKNVNEAISLLTGLPAGERDKDGNFPEGSVNCAVEQRLLEMAELKHEDQSKDEHEHHHAHDEDETKDETKKDE